MALSGIADTGRSRFGVCTDLFVRSTRTCFRKLVKRRQFALAVFRLSSHPGGRLGHPHLPLPGRRVMRCTLTCGVPLPACGPAFRGSAGTLSPFRQRSWDLPFAALILPARLPDVSVYPDPPAVFRAFRLDRFHRVSAGINYLWPATSAGEIPTHFRTRPTAKNLSRLLGR